MRFSTIFLLIAVFSSTLLLSACGQDDNLVALEAITDAQLNEKNTSGAINLGIEDKEESTENTIKSIHNTNASYPAYTAKRFKQALADNKQVILVFYKESYQSCKQLETDILARLSSLPEKVVLLKVNLDTDASKGKEYDIQSPNTVIYLDKKGKETFRLNRGIIKLQQILNAIK